jgi:L-amino acid N-acyltransferase YncA
MAEEKPVHKTKDSELDGEIVIHDARFEDILEVTKLANFYIENSLANNLIDAKTYQDMVYFLRNMRKDELYFVVVYHNENLVGYQYLVPFYGGFANYPGVYEMTYYLHPDYERRFNLGIRLRATLVKNFGHKIRYMLGRYVLGNKFFEKKVKLAGAKLVYREPRATGFKFNKWIAIGGA